MTGKVCDECGEEVRLKVTRMTQHSGCSRGCHSQKYSAHIAIGCGCTQESAKTTELTTIEFNGKIPNQWQ